MSLHKGPITLFDNQNIGFRLSGLLISKLEELQRECKQYLEYDSQIEDRKKQIEQYYSTLSVLVTIMTQRSSGHSEEVLNETTQSRLNALRRSIEDPWISRLKANINRIETVAGFELAQLVGEKNPRIEQVFKTSSSYAPSDPNLA